jgi:alkylhydroperoxidase family enzyme
VPDEDSKQVAHRALVDRILHGAGQASAELRARAFSNADLPSPVQALIGKVAASPADITGADFAAAAAAGFTDDQLFELVIAAAVGQSARLYGAGLAALAEAAASAGPDNAT